MGPRESEVPGEEQFLNRNDRRGNDLWDGVRRVDGIVLDTLNFKAQDRTTQWRIES